MDPIWWRGLLKAIVLPPTGPLLLALGGLLLARRRPRPGLALAAAGLALLLLLALPAVSRALLASLEVASAFDPADVHGAQALVVLGGGKRRNSREYGGDTLGTLTLERVRYGAWLARRTGLPVLVSGGSVRGGAPEAALMRRTLEEEFGVPVRWVEDGSRDTRENARQSARMLLPDVSRIVLVAHAFDLRRAQAEFAAAGFEVIPAPLGSAGVAGDFLDELPSVGALQGSWYALYEILGEGWRRLRPRSTAPALPE